MRKSKKQLLRTLIACGLVVSVAAGGTVAYLTDAETATNTFTVGKVKIDLEEPGYPGNDSDEVKNIVPNQEIVKDPQIENTGNNDALVFYGSRYRRRHLRSWMLVTTLARRNCRICLN